ncbi:MAG: hypothetical protein JXB05_17135 [Myxococcaceae bacterium]|nr:hypothetical protein [Myxococcaceae bacterium]
MSTIVAVATDLPPTYYDQERLSTEWAKFFAAHDLGLAPGAVQNIFRNSQVRGRYCAFGLERFADPLGTGYQMEDANAIAVEMCETNVNALLDRAGLRPKDISLLASVTNLVAIPSLEARLMNCIGFPTHTRRMPFVGLGCMAGAAGIARISDYLAGHPSEAVVLMSAELCSGMWHGSLQRDFLALEQQRKTDPSRDEIIVSNVVFSAIFGDGASAVLLVGREHPLAKSSGSPRVLGSRSMLLPNTTHLMGLELLDTGLRNILGAEVPVRAKAGLGEVILGLLKEHELGIGDIGRWIVHPGGPKVIRSAAEVLGLPESTLSLSAETLARIGNVSSSTVLFMLEEIQRAPPPPGTYGMMVAMGPGFSQEAVLLRW